MSVLFKAFKPATSPEAEAAVLGKVQFRQGMATDVVGYNPWSTVRQLAGMVRMVFPRSAFRR